ncbi:hypothetical protein PPACK8108_LOCUS20987 [Phakopsora pachyrhizi]|uniref:Uncharacterized protein n=1 Tax=Phakopsora pachyrhizi TaxID=170000 RepID=A0AAV0BK44_PHAPC|nr:hypothetical protein PPACK8108_LOCUS592 [Phakopsora pachyrhizi]CAH7686348.1 hypothetical protein PPACK8108_LOCUS20987 [Phakopsora pachyrhizi]
MSNSQTKRELPKRSSLVENAFNRSITNVLKPIDSQTLSEAFPFATEAMIESLSDQTKTLFSHYSKDRWEAFSEEASFKDLCDQFDKLEKEAIQRIQSPSFDSNSQEVTRDPKLSIPPILIETLTSILKLYQSRLDQQNVLNDLLQSTISSKVLEISKMEKSIKSRLVSIESSLKQLDDVKIFES